MAASEGDIILTPNEHRVAEDRRECYWLYVVTDCASESPKLQAIADPARHPWKPIKVAHFRLTTKALANG